MAWPELLRRIFRERGLNLSAVERQIGLGKNRLSQMAGGHEPRVTDSIRVARFLGMAVEELFGDGIGVATETTVKSKPRISGLSGWLAFELSRGAWKGKASLKVVGESRMLEAEDFRGQKGFVPLIAPIAAGAPREAHDKGFPAGAADKYVEFEADDPQAFALRVDGDSMLPDFRHGDIIVTRPSTGRKRSGIADGMAAVVIFAGERTATFKIVRFGSVSATKGEPMDYKLEPLNPAFPPTRLKTKEIAAIYPVVGLIRKE